MLLPLLQWSRAPVPKQKPGDFRVLVRFQVRPFFIVQLLNTKCLTALLPVAERFALLRPAGQVDSRICAGCA